MESEKPIVCGPDNSYTVELPFDNDLDQDELNRTMRKQGDKPYDPAAKWLDPAVVAPIGSQEKSACEAR